MSLILTSNQRKRLWLFTLSALGLGIAVSLILYALRLNINLYLTPSSLNSELIGKKIKLGGMVLPNSIVYSDHDLLVNFKLTDPKGMAEYNVNSEFVIRVEYTGLLPDLFKQGSDVIAIGSLQQQETELVFNAVQILAKHDENYKPKIK